jgi:hypothetical protein
LAGPAVQQHSSSLHHTALDPVHLILDLEYPEGFYFDDINTSSNLYDFHSSEDISRVIKIGIR